VANRVLRARDYGPFLSFVERCISLMKDKDRVERILDELERMYPNVGTALRYSSPFELLVATILSAQCTDAQVNKVTKRLFAKYNTPQAILELGQQRLAQAVYECGFYRNKSRNIIGACERLVNEYGSKVPDSLEELMTLPGVGRKTANVVLSNAFGKDAIAVDTHVFRVSRRLGLAQAGTPEAVERELMQVVPKDKWSSTHHRLINHGRRICKARKPQCEICPLSPYCRYWNELKTEGD
jgi:endonuclease-3